MILNYRERYMSSTNENNPKQEPADPGSNRPQSRLKTLILPSLFMVVAIGLSLFWFTDNSHIKDTEKTANAPEEIVLNKSNLREFGEMVNALNAYATADLTLPENAGLKNCFANLKQNSVSQLMPILQNLIDAKVQDLHAQRHEKFRVSNDYVQLEDWKDCSQWCFCGTYLSYFEKIDSPPLTHSESDAFSYAQSMASQMTGADSLKCSQKQTSLCDGELLKYLVNESRLVDSM
jgi:hypothetical protein